MRLRRRRSFPLLSRRENLCDSRAIFPIHTKETRRRGIFILNIRLSERYFMQIQ